MPDKLPEPVKLDLRNLTQAHIDEALPKIGQCKYAAPCIIGTLMPEDVRERFDNTDENGLMAGLVGASGYQLDQNPVIGELVSQDLVEFPDDRQRDLASELQMAFDNDGIIRFRDAVNKVNRAYDLNLVVPV